MLKSGVTETTKDNFFIGPGLVYKGFVSPSQLGTLLGATKGGNEVNIEKQWYVPEIDGALGAIMGTRRLVGCNVKLTTNLLEVTKENIMLALAGSVSEDYGTPTKTHDKITDSGELADTDYQPIAIVGQRSGSDEPVIFVVKNALATEPFNLPTGTGKDDAVLRVAFFGHYDPADPTEIPYEIYSPVIPVVEEGN